MGGVSYFAEKGIVSILSEESKCRLVVTVVPRAPSATEKGLPDHRVRESERDGEKEVAAGTDRIPDCCPDET